ncbi:hypothetical protein QTO34_002495 [Cnephaeus nilssonii]|uniref:Tissue factor pathway inhibitor n=1 Tax=Cnephaeus nilssonii TaxID=3371016 RepID=A0AA40LK79_CNENI|nr:hypothetical protein QTO34_002495 [Eptesicus nilssonii]
MMSGRSIEEEALAARTVRGGSGVTAVALPAGPVSPEVGLAHQFCAYRADTGPCRASLPRFFFNVLTGQCEAFVYGGCRGNENRFGSREECRQRCLAGELLSDLRVSDPQGARLLLLEAEVGFCRAYFTRFFYNHRTRRCEQFVFGGCGGNRNNFETEAECQRACGARDDSTPPPVSSTPRAAQENARVGDFSTPSWCLTGADRGQCTANVTRFYYDSEAGTCLAFGYSGCGGNENNFVSERACLKACKKGGPAPAPRGPGSARLGA